jgi:hypothetical protein
MSLATTGINSGRFAISGATNANHGVYTVELSAFYDQTATSSFALTITNPCSETTFDVSENPLSQMSIQLANSGTVTQTFKVWTALELAYPSLICPISAMILEDQNFIYASVDATTIIADGPNLTAAIPESLGTSSYTLVVNSKDFAGLVPQVAFVFNLEVSCKVTEMRSLSEIQDITLEIDP